jgi:hypothetical protein
LNGSLTKSVVVMTNDPRQPEVILSVAALVEQEFALSERGIFFAGAPRGQQAVREVTVTIPADKPLRILGAESTDRNVTVRVEPVPGTGDKKYKVIATRKPDAAEGYHFGTITLKTTSTTSPEVKIAVRGVVIAQKSPE